ncbi:MAG: caspase family protein [Kaiparowitsia implicata GSE-PSE-MK54-09C]|jgi:hypothetical protein|nr:caspase family protein [Kaiparowitsia implicata GSE-PSE-MK54-09C]
MKRRHFLQAAGSSLAAIGLSQTNFLRQANHYGKALAQGTPRKLALLVGVNQYPGPSVPELYGCLNDVNMQYELLKHRFGFKEADILRVTDDSGILPTRANILQAFEEHLIQQVKPGDIVVFHYSGHGSRVEDPQPITVAQCGGADEYGRNGTLVTRDAGRVRTQGQNEIEVADIMGRTLFLLSQRLDTDNVTLVLDSCHSGAGTRGNARVRSATSARISGNPDVVLKPIPDEIEQQERWMKDLSLDEVEFHRRRSLGIAKGVALGSASCDQEAWEMPFDNGESSGIFTYLLTSYLWQVPGAEAASTTQVNLVRSTRITAATESRQPQVPIFEAAPDSNSLGQPLYFTSSLAPFADAVVRTVTDSQIEFWLGGLSPQTLKTARVGTVYSLIDPATGNTLGDVELESRNGLLAYGKLTEGQTTSVKPGLLLREKVAALAVPSLRIGIDSSLSTERVVAETALNAALGTTTTTSGQAVNRITVLPVDQQADVEFVLARTSETMQADLRTAGATSPPPIGSVGLYAADLSVLVPNTAGPVNESASAAVNRLRPRFRALLVARALQQLAGTPTSLRVGGEIFSTSGQGPTVPIAGEAAQGDLSRLRTQVTTATYPSGDVIQLRVNNEEATDVYLSCLVIDSQGNTIALYPNTWNAPDEAARIDANETLVVPRPEDGFQFRLRDTGFVEVLTIVSRQPLRGILRNLQAIAQGRGDTRGPVGFTEGNPLSLIDDLLSDVDGMSRSSGSVEVEMVSTEDTAVAPDAIAAFSTVIEIVE